MSSEIELLIDEFGEEYRQMIVDSVNWLNKTEQEWNSDITLDRRRFVKDLVDYAKFRERRNLNK
jgi:hypothetical protein